LHVMEEFFLSEVVDPLSGEAMAEGSEGELILTTLHRVDAPVLRYRTGDRVVARHFKDTPCECGRFQMALEGGILGRADDMGIIRGVNMYPSALEAVLGGFDEIVEYRATVRE